jgi:hypothetical protein
MDEFEVQCNECDWQGYALDLVSKTADLDDKDFKYCPNCGSDDIDDIDYEDY